MRLAGSSGSGRSSSGSSTLGIGNGSTKRASESGWSGGRTGGGTELATGLLQVFPGPSGDASRDGGPEETVSRLHVRPQKAGPVARTAAALVPSRRKLLRL